MVPQIHGCRLFMHAPGRRDYGSADCERKAFSLELSQTRLVRAAGRSKCATKRSSAPVAPHLNLDKSGSAK